MGINAWVGPVVRCEGQLAAVLYDGPAGDVDVEGGGAGGVDTQLLTSQHEHTLHTILQKHRAAHRPTQNA